MSRFLSFTRVLTYVFLLAPLVIVVISSFSGSAVLAFPPRSFTTAWYSSIQPSFFSGLYVSLVVAALTAAISIILGVPGALALVRGRFPGRDTLNAICLSPLMVPALVTGVALFQFSILVWDVSGVILGGTIAGLVIGHLTFAIPFVVRSVVAADARSDPSLEEAAKNLGATPRQTFFLVTLPLLKPGIASGTIFAFLTSFDDVPIALLMGGGDATTLPVRIFTAIEINFGGEILAVASLIVVGSFLLMFALDRAIGLEMFFGARD